MRELVSSTSKQKPLIALIDLDGSRGGLDLVEIHKQLIEADDLYGKWAFNHGTGSLRGEALHAHLCLRTAQLSGTASATFRT